MFTKREETNDNKSERYNILIYNWNKYLTLWQDWLQPAGEDGLCPESTVAGRVVAAALATRAASVPLLKMR